MPIMTSLDAVACGRKSGSPSDLAGRILESRVVPGQYEFQSPRVTFLRQTLHCFPTKAAATKRMAIRVLTPIGTRLTAIR